MIINQWLSLTFEASASTAILIVDDSFSLLSCIVRALLHLKKILQPTYICIKVLHIHFKASKSTVDNYRLTEEVLVDSSLVRRKKREMHNYSFVLGHFKFYIKE
jgi:hypothetical protein